MTDHRADTVAKPSFFRFSGNANTGQEIVSKHASSGSSGMLLDTNVGGRFKKCLAFSDMRTYESLCQQAGCVRVEIHSIGILYPTPTRPGNRRHCGTIYDIPVTYKQFFSDGSTQRVECTTYYCSDPFSKDTVFELQDGEYITGLKIYQRQFLEGVIFVTNLREVRCGYTGETPRGLFHLVEASTPPNSRIVAFFRSHKRGFCQRIGYYAEPFRWGTLGPYISLRELVRQGRAEKLPIGDDLLHQIVQSDERVFRHIMRFCPTTLSLDAERSYLQKTVHQWDSTKKEWKITKRQCTSGTQRKRNGR